MKKKMPPKKTNQKKETKIRYSKPTDAEMVADWLNKLDTKTRSGIEEVRKIIKGASPKLGERIKWNAPSYYYKEDIVTFGPARDPGRILLVFHHPNIVKIKSVLLEGNYKDRRLTWFDSKEKIKSGKKELERIIAELVRFLDK